MTEISTPDQVLLVTDQTGTPNEAPPDETWEPCLYMPPTIEDSLAMETWAMVNYLATAICSRLGEKTSAR